MNEHKMTEPSQVDFGYKKVTRKEKDRRVGHVFSSVADRYDLMNDLMSFGIHRIWKRFSVHIANLRPDVKVLDLAGGTGDMAILIQKRLDERGQLVLCDINRNMLIGGRDKLYDQGVCKGIDYVQANAEELPYKDNTFDCVIMAFGLRNVTDKEKALRSIYSKLKYGGSVNILEFSKVTIPALQQLYDQYSFSVIPLIGEIVARDRDSYQYLVESIRMHPDQETLKSMMQAAGFCRVEYHNMTAGVVAHHKGYKL